MITNTSINTPQNKSSDEKIRDYNPEFQDISELYIYTSEDLFYINYILSRNMIIGSTCSQNLQTEASVKR